MHWGFLAHIKRKPAKMRSSSNMRLFALVYMVIQTSRWEKFQFVAELAREYAVIDVCFLVKIQSDLPVGFSMRGHI